MTNHRSFSERLRAAPSPSDRGSAAQRPAGDAPGRIFGQGARRAPTRQGAGRPPPLSAYERLDQGLLAIMLRPRRLAVLIALGAAIFYLRSQGG